MAGRKGRAESESSGEEENTAKKESPDQKVRDNGTGKETQSKSKTVTHGLGAMKKKIEMQKKEELQRQLEIARDVMRENREVLRKLAKA